MGENLNSRIRGIRSKMNGHLQEIFSSTLMRPLAWVRSTFDRLLPVHPPDEDVSPVDGSSYQFDHEPSAGPLFTRTRVVPVSRASFRRNRIVAMEECGMLADQFKLLRTQLFQHTRPGGLNAIQISGFNTGEGKSLVAVNLAISIARDARQTTLLVDADLRNPSIHKLLDLGSDVPGLKQHLLDGMPLEEILVSPGIEKLSVLPAGGKINHSTELIGSPAMETLVRELKERYRDRYVIFDTPPVNECSDPLVFCEYVDAMILVARADFTTSDAVRAAMDRIPREKVLGIVLNDARIDG